MTWQADGTGIIGTTSATATAVGYVGEILTASPGAVVNQSSVGSGNPLNVTSLSLTAGHWLLVGYVEYENNGATSNNYLRISLSTTSLTVQTSAGRYSLLSVPSVFTSFTMGAFVGVANVEISSPTTYYLVAMADYSGTTSRYTTNSQIKAIRIA